MGNQKWTIQRNWQHGVQKRKKKKAKTQFRYQHVHGILENVQASSIRIIVTNIYLWLN